MLTGMLVVSLSVLCALALAELALRVARRARSPQREDGVLASIADAVALEAGMVRLRAHAAGWSRAGSSERVVVRTNSQGFRGPEPRLSAARRVVLVGDSVVFDPAVEWEASHVGLLRRRLHEQGQDIEVVNAGLPDVGIDQYLLQVSRGRFAALRPDWVVVGLYLNDARPPQGFVGENYTDGIVAWLGTPPQSRLALVQLLREAYILSLTRRGLPLYHRFEWLPRFQQRRWRDDPAELVALLQDARFDWGSAWDLGFPAVVFPALQEIRARVQAGGARLALVIYPASPQVETRVQEPFWDLPQRKLAGFASEQDIPVLDLLPVLRATGRQDLFVDQCHFNAQGNAVVAEALHRFVLELLAIPAPGATTAPAEVRATPPPR